MQSQGLPGMENPVLWLVTALATTSPGGLLQAHTVPDAVLLSDRNLLSFYVLLEVAPGWKQ